MSIRRAWVDSEDKLLTIETDYLVKLDTGEEFTARLDALVWRGPGTFKFTRLKTDEVQLVDTRRITEMHVVVGGWEWLGV